MSESNRAKIEAEKRLEKLREVINHHRYLYHVLDRSEISDSALDSLKKELTDLEALYPDLVTKDSPSQRVAGVALDKFSKVRHQIPQWSFNDAFTKEEISDFDTRVKRFLKGEIPTYTAELKIDGFKIVLTYEQGVLITGATRGDGVIGEDVTTNVRTIESIPLKLNQPIDLVVEGEIWLSVKEFKRINREREKIGEPIYANPRNLAAGTIRQLDASLVASRSLDSFIYDIASASIELPTTQLAELELLKSLGFKVNPHFLECDDIEAVVNFWQKWQTKTASLPYGVDGVVVKVNERNLQERLGYTGKAPRFAIAFKFPAEQSTTMIEDISLQVGRTGVITPVAHLKPVLLAGSTVSRATLHNEDEIKRLDVRIGDTVILEKAGDIIPHIVSVLTEFRTGREKRFAFPTYLEACGGPIERVPGQVAYRCVNKNSFAQLRRKFYHFVSKGAFNIEGMGPKMLDLLLNEHLLSDFADIFTLKKGDLLNLPRLAEKSADNLLTAIDRSRNITLARLLVSLSIPHVGEETAEIIAREFKTLSGVKEASFKSLSDLAGIGDIMAGAVCDWFESDQAKKLLPKLLKQIKIVSDVNNLVANSSLAGKTFVLTGTLTNFSRDEAKKLIKTRGGKVLSAVSSATHFLVMGENPGSKLKEAQKLGVKILAEAEFKALLNKK